MMAQGLPHDTKFTQCWAKSCHCGGSISLELAEAHLYAIYNCLANRWSLDTGVPDWCRNTQVK